MKFLSCLIATILITTSTVFAQTKATDIVGTWQTKSKDAHLTMYQNGDQFFGKISWLKASGKDTKNPKTELRTRDLVGTVILTNFVFNGRDKWTDGKIYDPSGGKTYSCNMKLTNIDTLEIRGYIGISLLGRTEIWTRL